MEPVAAASVRRAHEDEDGGAGQAGQDGAAAATLRITLLSGVTASVDGRPARLSGRLGRSTLAVLALEPGRVVSVERLVDRLWGERPPVTSAAQVHTQVSRLRAALADVGAGDAVRRAPGGYRLDPARARTDLAAAEEQLRAARLAEASGQPAAAAEAYRAALAGWPGPELDGVTSALADVAVRPLMERRLSAVEGRIAAELEVGPPGPLIPELDALVAAHPLRETLHQMRMLALRRAGRRAEALVAYQAARRVLRDELGMDPSPALRELAAEILATGAASASAAAAARRPCRPPAQLPALPPLLVGREDELATLRAALSRRAPAGRCRTVVLHGLPGSGKTALALHAARTLTDLSDGQLYADFTADAAAAPAPAAVLDRFLRSLGGEPADLPSDLPGRAAELRARTAGRRLLVLLDNAATLAEVEPLLPAEAECVALVTSRSPMAALDACCRIRLGPLPAAAGLRMLAAAAVERVDAEPAAAAAVVRRCAGLPVAIRIAAARLVAAPHVSAAELAERLGDDARRIDELAVGDLQLRRFLDAAMRPLSSEARGVVDALAGLGEATFSARAVALLGEPHRPGHAALDELVALSLVEPLQWGASASGRFRLHELIRLRLRGCGVDPTGPAAEPAARTRAGV